MKLKLAIDQRGQYAYKLNDFATGYAAGKGISSTEARQQIEEQFRRDIGHSPKEYLDQCFQARKTKGQERAM